MGLAMLCGSATSSRADAIDGKWCHADGRRLTIRGPQIATPGGAKMSGDYTRHSFHYVVPPGEPGTGETMSMVLLSEYLERDDFSPNRHPALGICWSMIFSENRYPLFGIML
jgi:hypothetical protein